MDYVHDQTLRKTTPAPALAYGGMVCGDLRDGGLEGVGMMPIIIPVTNTRTKTIECILQDGRKYCEVKKNEPIDGGQAAVALLIIGAIAAYVSLSFYVAMKFDNGFILACLLIAPFFIGGLILL